MVIRLRVSSFTLLRGTGPADAPTMTLSRPSSYRDLNLGGIPCSPFGRRLTVAVIATMVADLWNPQAACAQAERNNPKPPERAPYRVRVPGRRHSPAGPVAGATSTAGGGGADYWSLRRYLPAWAWS